MKQLSCDQCRERWDDLINKSTFEADPQFADVCAHLESCADCRKTFDLLVGATQELQQLPTQKAPTSLRANIISQIEKPQQQSVPWWHSFLISSQRLAWASGAIVAIFVVALLLRPEYQSQVNKTVPQRLSNQAQVEEHNSAPLQPSISSSKPNNDSHAKKVLPGKPHTVKLAKSPTPKLQRPPYIESGSAKNSKPHQIEIAPKPKPVASSDTPLSEQLKDQPLQKPTPSKSSVPQAQRFAAPAPINNDFAANEGTVNKAAGIAQSSSQDSAIQSMPPTNRIMPQEAEGPEGRGGAAAMFKSQSKHQIIHWSKTITSDYDVTNAKIIATLEEGLTFAGDSQGQSERIVWQGTLSRGKQIPLDIDLQRVSDGIGELHLRMINADTQKVLLNKTLEVK
ncbi:MAG: hypothetical protein ABI210_06295 [Abditibacteriaceae bacterium]